MAQLCGLVAEASVEETRSSPDSLCNTTAVPGTLACCTLLSAHLAAAPQVLTPVLWRETEAHEE
jgi:hypothetical protein